MITIFNYIISSSKDMLQIVRRYLKYMELTKLVPRIYESRKIEKQPNRKMDKTHDQVIGAIREIKRETMKYFTIS